MPVPIRPSPYWGHQPSAKQGAFLSLPHLEALYGGAAGGGKSDALLMAALQYVDVPNYSALLLRRTYPELAQPGGIMERAEEWLLGKARWNQADRIWTFPSGAKLAFGYLQRSEDKKRYQGAEFDFIGFDELTHFEEADYLYLFSRIRRRAGSLVPPRMRGATNPGGRGHRWVKRRFLDKLPAEDDPSDTEAKCRARVFIPAKLDDNPGIDQATYREALAMLDPQTQAQLLDGDWEAREPGAWVFDSQAIDACVALGAEYDRLREAGELPPPVDHAICLGIDYGDFATVAEVIWPLERGGLYVCPGEVSTSRADLEEIAGAFLDAAARYDYWFAEARYDSSFAQSNRTFAKIAEKRLGRHNAIKRTGRPNTYPANFGKYKDLSIRFLRLLMRRTLERETTRVLAISPHNHLLIEQLRDLQENEEGKVIKGNDDAADALIAGAVKPARAFREVVEAQAEEAKQITAGGPAAERAAARG